MESTPMSGSSKRAKALGSIAQIAHCLVDGCNADLSQCREYHRRHKVCELHSKTAKVTIAGREQRFCQQCSRFHSLVEFDEVKRSCRKRLDGHNRRRRKPQPELSRNSGLLPQGTRLLSFGSSQIFPSSVLSSTWTGSVKPENNVMLYNNQSNLNYPEPSPTHGYKGSLNQFQFVQSTGCGNIPEGDASTICQPLLDPNPRSINVSSSQKIFSDGLNQVNIHSDRALSLLSSAPTGVTGEIGFSPMLQGQSLAHHNLHYGSPPPGHFPFALEKSVVSETSPSQISSNATLHFQEMFQNGADESSSTGSHQTLTFLWE